VSVLSVVKCLWI